MRASAWLFVPICALTGSLALPQSISSSSVSLPGINLSPADQTACVQSCSQSVAQKRPDALNACLATGNPAPNCLCTDATLGAEMQKCFVSRCPPLQGVCAAILGGSSFVGGTVVGGGSSSVSPGAPGQSSGGSVSPGSPGQSSGSGGSVSLPDVPLPPAQQTACVQSCSDDVARNEPDALDACLDATGNPAANCLCTDATLAAEMQRCFASRCPPLQGRCAAIIGGTTFAAGTPGGAGNSGAGTGTPDTGNQSADDVSFPDVQLPPAQQTACVQSCSADVAANVPDALDACVDATGSSAANCLCTDDTLAAEMQKCFGARCAPLQGRCAAIIDGGVFVAGTTGPPAGAGTPGAGEQPTGGSISFPDVQLPPAQQTACVQSCSEDVTRNVPDALDACLDATGNSAANCLCTDDTLAAEMQKCFAARCAPLEGRCAAIIDGVSFIAGTAGNSGSSSPGTVGSGTTAPGSAETGAPGTVGDSAPTLPSTGDGAPGGADAGAPTGSSDGAPGGSAEGTPEGSADDAAGASSTLDDNDAGGGSPGTSPPDAPGAETDAGGQPSPASGVPPTPSSASPSPTTTGASPSTTPSGASTSAAEASPSTPSSASDGVNPTGAGNPDNSAHLNGAAPLALALSLAFGLFL